jgi:DNA invertase Pin-like site-specific DNA recombinase
MRIVGYARVSTQDQDLSLQINDLKENGCGKIFSDKVSGAKFERIGLKNCLTYLKEGDTLMVWRIDRLGRSLRHLVAIVSGFQEKGINFKSLNDGAIDTTTASGELVFNIFCSMAQFERKLIQERTRAGLEAARAQGKFGGRKAITGDDKQVKLAKKLNADSDYSIKDICTSLKISRATFYRYLKIN